MGDRGRLAAWGVMVMEVEVYADLLFLINAGMDGLCFSITARLLHRRPRGWRMALGAGIGGVYAVLALLLTVNAGWALAADILVCLGMCAVVFGLREGRGVRGLLGTAAVYTALSLVMGGVMTALFNLCNRIGLSDALPHGGEGIGAWLFLVASVVGSVLSLRGGRLCRRSATVRICDVCVELDGRSVTVRGLVDSGNLLRDPLGGRAVICLSPTAARRILPPSWESVLRSGGNDLSGVTDTRDLRRLRLIPAGGATGDGLMPGFRPDRVLLYPEEGRAARSTSTPEGRGRTGRIVDAVVAVLPAPPQGVGALGAVDALIPAELL